MALHKSEALKKTFPISPKTNRNSDGDENSLQALLGFTFSCSGRTRCYRLIRFVSVGSAGSSRAWRSARLSDLSRSSSCASSPLSPDSWRRSRCHIASPHAPVASRRSVGGFVVAFRPTRDRMRSPLFALSHAGCERAESSAVRCVRWSNPVSALTWFSVFALPRPSRNRNAGWFLFIPLRIEEISSSSRLDC